MRQSRAMDYESVYRLRNLVIVLGDQLDTESSAFDEFDRNQDMLYMSESDSELTHVWSHKARIAVTLSAMRHFRDHLRYENFNLQYWELEDSLNRGDFGALLYWNIGILKPRKLIVTEPGDYRMGQLLARVAKDANVDLEVRPDRSFYCSKREFAGMVATNPYLRMEAFYRALRRKHGILMDKEKPVGGQWNFHKENREPFDKDGPPLSIAPVSFPPDAITQEVIDLVRRKYGGHPGSLNQFDWPTTPVDANMMLQDFIEHRLPFYGTYHDAMWSKQPYLYHSRLSVALNLKLISASEVIHAAEHAYRGGKAPLNAVEGFIRQVLGWREYSRGIYWFHMPEYLEKNELDAHGGLPEFYWTGETDMECLKTVIKQTLALGYQHHMQRLMVTGMFALVLGVDPKEVHEWFLAMHIDGVEWIEVPGTLGLSQFADGGLMASKPCASSGKYIKKMSDYCDSCRYKPEKAAGSGACPFTTFYWEFLMKHREKLGENPKMAAQYANLAQFTDDQRASIMRRAQTIRTRLTISATRPAAKPQF